MTAQKKEISLLSKDEFEKTRLGKFLKWALTFGRWIVIFTELVVILCFLSRFKLDRDLTDLGEKIKQQQAIIVSFGDLEKNVRSLQERLVIIGDLEKKQLLACTLLDELSATVPLDVSLRDLVVGEKKVNISAVALSEAGLDGFIRGLSESRFNKISLDKVNRKKTGEIEFDLTAQVGD
ncbi:PilN domain-containing protein [Candidatus Microgenomates bacterium]|nr:PilN domain-containing protein [Candidatus Microgenomates bacterium]